MFVCKPCGLNDRTTDTVQFDATALQQAEEERRSAEEERAAADAIAEQQSQLRATEQAAAEEAARRHAEEQSRAAEAAELRAREARSRREREERERAEVAELERRASEEAAETARLQQQQKERSAAVQSFLKAQGFTSITAPKRRLLKSSYAIHSAAEKGDEVMCRMLLEEGADPKQKNSSGKTAAEVALKKNKKNSHTGVLSVLDAAIATSLA